VTQLLIDWSNGDKSALDKLVPIVDQELRRLAHHYMRGERQGTLCKPPRSSTKPSCDWPIAKGPVAKPRSLLRHCRSTNAYDSRGPRAQPRLCKTRGGADKLELNEALVVSQQKASEVIALDEALKELELIDPRQSRIVELRFFGGLTVEEAAEVLHVSPVTIKREWSTAKAWLYRNLVED
jgi:RNA polymerase sigma factor (sigma-70 family)